jgi:acetylglutamate kinase
LNKVTVVKIGGATLGSQDTTIEDLVYLQQQGTPLVVVHGGGKLITEWLARQDIPTRFIHGERVSNAATLEVSVAVLAGWVNKEITAAVNKQGGRAVGICGVDGAIIQTEVKNSELGYVGDIIKVDITLLEVILQSGYIPVVAPIGLLATGKSEETVWVLNINADYAAGEVAVALAAERLIFLTDVVGVCNQSGALLPQLSPGEAEALLASGVATGGMIPKVKACLRALASASTTRIIDGRQPQALRQELEGNGSGTTIQAV